jgi:hypothetical protein
LYRFVLQDTSWIVWCGEKWSPDQNIYDFGV